jgi:hypothetical protein
MDRSLQEHLGQWRAWVGSDLNQVFHTQPIYEDWIFIGRGYAPID